MPMSSEHTVYMCTRDPCCTVYADAVFTSGSLTAKEIVVKHSSRHAVPTSSALAAIPSIVAEDQLLPM